jgi:hypothetical protein
MKIALLFLTIGCGMLLSSTAHATDNTNPRQKALQTARPTSHREAVAKPGHGSVPLPRPATPHRVTNPKSSATEKNMNADHRILGQAKNPTNANLSGNRTSNHLRIVQPSLVPRPAASTPSNARHHGPNPAIIGGPKNAAAADTAALSGSTLHRRQGRIVP